MPVHRKRFRIEEAFAGALPAAEIPDGVDIGPLHSEIMAELRAIRAQMAGGAASGLMPAAGDPSALRQIAETQAMLETYRAQIEQCEKLKVELDLIHDAISRTKREIAVLHGKSFNGEEMAKVNGELGAVVGGSRPAAVALLVAGVVGLGITLLHDLPNTTKKGEIGVAFARAKAHKGAGFWVELVASALAIGAGAFIVVRRPEPLGPKLRLARGGGEAAPEAGEPASA